MRHRLAALSVVAMFCATPALAQDQKESGNPVKSTSAYLDALRKNTTTAGKVALAEAAGPREIARHATIIEMVTPKEMKTLRAGTNGWTCIADPRGPMCLDETFKAWVGALMSKMEPNIARVGVAFMLVGDEGASLTDPFATEKTADWVVSDAHSMIVLPDAKQLEGLPDNPKSGGAYVMWKGTPYAHIMLPSK